MTERLISNQEYNMTKEELEVRRSKLEKIHQECKEFISDLDSKSLEGFPGLKLTDKGMKPGELTLIMSPKRGRRIFTETYQFEDGNLQIREIE